MDNNAKLITLLEIIIDIIHRLGGKDITPPTTKYREVHKQLMIGEEAMHAALAAIDEIRREEKQQ